MAHVLQSTTRLQPATAATGLRWTLPALLGIVVGIVAEHALAQRAAAQAGLPRQRLPDLKKMYATGGEIGKPSESQGEVEPFVSNT